MYFVSRSIGLSTRPHNLSLVCVGSNPGVFEKKNVLILTKKALLVKLSTNSMRLDGKASVPAGGSFMVLLPAGGPFVYFRAIDCKCFISCCLAFFSQQPLLLTTSADFLSYLVLNFATTALSPKLLTPPPAPPRRRRSRRRRSRRRRCCCCCLPRKLLKTNIVCLVMTSPSLSSLLYTC